MRISDWSSDVRSSDLHWDPHSRQYALVPLRTNHRHTRITLCSTVVDYTCIDAAQARTDPPPPHEPADRCPGTRDAPRHAPPPAPPELGRPPSQECCGPYVYLRVDAVTYKNKQTQ